MGCTSRGMQVLPRARTRKYGLNLGEELVRCTARGRELKLFVGEGAGVILGVFQCNILKN